MSSLETADGELGREDIENVQCFQNYVQTGSWGGQTHIAICKKQNTKDTKIYLEFEFYFKMHVLIYTFSFAFEFNEHKKHANHTLQIYTNLEVHCLP